MGDQRLEIDGATNPGAGGNHFLAGRATTVGGLPATFQTTRGVSARNTYGKVTALAAGATATVVSLAADVDYRCWGVRATGETDAYWIVEYDGVTQYPMRSSIIELNPSITLPAPDPMAAGTLVRVRVTNQGTVAADFEAVLLGE